MSCLSCQTQRELNMPLAMIEAGRLCITLYFEASTTSRYHTHTHPPTSPGDQVLDPVQGRWFAVIGRG